jgi:cell division protein FtsI (penicillin-binding protein 3)
LEDGHVTIEDSVDLNHGTWRVMDRTVRDSEGWHPYKMATVKKAFERSSNVGIAKLIHQYYKDDKQKYVDHLVSMRLNQPVGIEIPGEPNPFIKTDPSDRNSWSGVTLPWMSYGYELEMTPLQILSFYNAVANGGKMVKPYLVSEIREFGQTVEKFEPQVLNEKICSDETIATARILLEGVVENGTARKLKNPHYTQAGKTGTAQLAKPGGGYQKAYRASFVGYFPADKPLYSCIVVVSNPKNEAFYGGSVAGPVFKEIADKVYANSLEIHEPVNHNSMLAHSAICGAKGLHSDLQTIYSQLDVRLDSSTTMGWLSLSKQDSTLTINEVEIDDTKTPNVTGMGLKDALYLLENQGFEVVVVGHGKVKKQSIRPGTLKTEDDKITIELG